MYIEELKEGGLESVEEQACGDSNKGAIVIWDAKKALVGAGGRALFYPTLLYNVVRNKVQPEFHWWDRVDEFILLGAVPFPADVPRLKALGVSGVVTLNEPFETLVPTSLYHDYNIAHLVIPTRDYLFAPAYGDICLAVNFIHDNACCGKTTYVHCKAGRGRSTTIVLCYLVKYRGMTPEAAYDHVRSIRPRVLLASSQRQAVLDYYFHVKKGENKPGLNQSVRKALTFPANEDSAAFEDGSMVVVTKSDLDGYKDIHDSSAGDKNRLSELNLACRFQFASQAAISRISCLWPRYQANGKVSRKKLGNSMESSEPEWVGVDIHVY